MKNILAIESSTAHASVAISRGGQILATEKSTNPKSHSEFLNPAIERCLYQARLTLAEIDVFASGLGPGSFTGLRVASSIAKTFAFTFQKPLVALDSLTLLFHGAKKSGAHQNKVLCLINAHKNMSYLALFSNGLAEAPPRAVTIECLNTINLQSESPVLCLGDGFTAYQKFWSPGFLHQIERDPQFSDFPTAQTLALASEEALAAGQTFEWNSFEPLYIRASEAEENQRVKSR